MKDKIILKCPKCFKGFRNSEECNKHFEETKHSGDYNEYKNLDIDALDDLITWKQSDVKIALHKARLQGFQEGKLKKEVEDDRA